MKLGICFSSQYLRKPISSNNNDDDYDDDDDGDDDDDDDDNDDDMIYLHSNTFVEYMNIC